MYCKTKVPQNKMIHLPFYLCTTFQYIIGHFFLFIFYSFHKIVKLNFFIGYDFFQDGAQIFCLETPVNITQYRRSAGIFDKRYFAFRPKFTNFIGDTCWSTSHMYLECISHTNHMYFKLIFRYFQ